MSFPPEYVYIHDGDRSEFFPSAGVAGRAGAALLRPDAHPNALYRIVVDGEERRQKDFVEARRQAVAVVAARPAGSNVALQSVRKTGEVIDQVRFRKVPGVPPVKDSRGVEGIDRVEGAIEDKFPAARFAGDCVCKPDSDHRDCAAVDYFDTSANMVKMRLMLMDNAAYFHLKYIILFDRIYFFDTTGTFTGSQDYTGTFHAHIHVSVYGGKTGSAC